MQSPLLTMVEASSWKAKLTPFAVKKLGPYHTIWATKKLNFPSLKTADRVVSLAAAQAKVTHGRIT